MVTLFQYWDVWWQGVANITGWVGHCLLCCLVSFPWQMISVEYFSLHTHKKDDQVSCPKLCLLGRFFFTTVCQGHWCVRLIIQLPFTFHLHTKPIHLETNLGHLPPPSASSIVSYVTVRVSWESGTQWWLSWGGLCYCHAADLWPLLYSCSVLVGPQPSYIQWLSQALTQDEQFWPYGHLEPYGQSFHLHQRPVAYQKMFLKRNYSYLLLIARLCARTPGTCIVILLPGLATISTQHLFPLLIFPMW